MENLIDEFIFEDFKLNMNFFSFDRSFRMFNKNFENLFKCKQRPPETPLLKIHMDIAASIQLVCNHLTEKVVGYAVKTTGVKNIALSGGVALNCVSNSNILKQDWCDNLWIQPASGDAGGSIGCALSSYYVNNVLKIKRKPKDFSCYLGPEYNEEQIESSLIRHEAVFEKFQLQKLLKIISKELSSGKVVGWFQGPAEFGPRALGNRSIIADPRIETMQQDLNLKIKFRESFRPFAPAVLYEMSDKYFKKQKTDSPFMLLVNEVKGKIKLPAVTHLDGSARLQTVKRSENEIFHSLLSEFYKETGCPVLINTSFNVRNEPMVLTPSDAYRCFMATNMDVLVIGNYILYKEDQPLSNVSRYYDNYDMD
jgi:carbamoyltransferase